MHDPLSPDAAEAESASDRKLREASMAAMKREGARVRALTGAAERVMESPTSLEAIAELKAVLLEQHLMSPVHAFENRIKRFLSLNPGDQRKVDCAYARKNYRGGPHPLSDDDYAKRMRDVGRGCRLLTGDALSQHLADRMSLSTWQDILSELDATYRSDPHQLAELRELPISRQDDSLDLRVQGPQKNAGFGEGGGYSLAMTPTGFDGSSEALFRDAIASYPPNQWRTGFENTRKTMGKVNRGTQAGWIFGVGTESVGFANCRGQPLVAKKNRNDEWQTLIATSLNEKTLAFFKLFPPAKFKMVPSRFRNSDA